MKTEQQLPKNIRQIGSPAGHTKVYIEDYVITFLNSLSMDKNTYVRGAILFGEKKEIGNDEKECSCNGPGSDHGSWADRLRQQLQRLRQLRRGLRLRQPE